MQDEQIVELYWQRSDRAISETALRFGSYCSTIARHILPVREGAKECVSDTWLRAWNSMPDNRRDRLAPYLGKITRSLALSRVLSQNSQKRGEFE